MLKPIDRLLNAVTMYRLTLYYLLVLIGWASISAFFHLLPFSGIDILLSTCIAISTGFVSNFIFARFFHAVTNVESVYITALILVLIVPVKLPLNLFFIIGATGFAMATKYLLTIEKQHVFNPAAISIAYISLLSSEHTATWWVGTPVMLPAVLIGGLLLIRKIRREKMVSLFLFVYFALIIATSFLNTQTVDGVIHALTISTTRTAVFFLAFMMLTEPLTAPSTENMQYLYAVLVAILDATPQLKLGLVLTPEMALCVGNIFSYFVSSRYRLILQLDSKVQLTKDTIEFIFRPVPNFNFVPGQYMEWTLPHKNADDRGNRRYFSLANSPTEVNVKLLVKFYEPPSTYKKELLSLNNGETIVASQLAGDFTLPSNLSKPYTFISGGVGVAPFRSMIKFIVDKKLTVNIVHLFINKTAEDEMYKELFQEAETYGVKTIYFQSSIQGHLTPEKIAEIIPNYKNRKTFISGPQIMVQTIEKTFIEAGQDRQHLKTDFFPGYMPETT